MRQAHAAVDRYQLVNSYGLFRRMTGVGGRPEVVIEGSYDGVTWTVRLSGHFYCDSSTSRPQGGVGSQLSFTGDQQCCFPVVEDFSIRSCWGFFF